MRLVSNYAFRRLADNHSPQQKLSDARLGRRPAVLRRVSALMALCFLWSLILVPSLSAAVPHSSARQRTGAGMFLLQTQAKKMALLQAHLSRFPYQLYAAQRTRPGQTPVPPPAADLSTPQTLLDEAGRLAVQPSPATVSGWKRALNDAAKPDAGRAAQLHLWLGEWALTHDQQPEQADWHLRAAMHLTGGRDARHGLAAYDRAIVLYERGAYGDAVDAFQRLLSPKTALLGYNRRTCAYWLRHASACTAYHDAHARLGIPEPPSLDPLCGAAALAASLAGAGLPSDRKTVLAACRPTGLGSSLADLVASGPRLGASVRAVTADEAGLRLLPKPLIAYVERDHFIAVVRADSKGVSYLCSDCGPWPGGQVNLTWKQWRALDPGAYAVVSRSGSVWDRTLAALGGASASPMLGMASRASTRVASLTLRGLLRPARVQTLLPSLALLRAHVVLFNNLPLIVCGSQPVSQHCTSEVECPVTCHSVNLATGEEEHDPTPDLTVYNPHGPSVTWQRSYGSLRGNGDGFAQGDPAYQCNDFGPEWTQPYNIAVSDPSGGTATGARSIVFPNGSRSAFTASAIPTAVLPVVHCAPLKHGTETLLDWNYDGSPGGHYTITFKNRTRWVTGPLIGVINCYPLSRIVDRNGHATTFNYGAPAPGFHWPLLSSITNEDGTALLTIQRATDGTGNIVLIQDCYNREVFYHDGMYSNSQVPKPWARSLQLLDRVSQIVPTGTNTNPPDRYVYAYQMLSNTNVSATTAGGYEQVPFLHTCSVPSPTGAGLSTYTWNYDATTDFVQSEIDGNGNETDYQSADAQGNPTTGQTNSTLVTVKDARGNVVYKSLHGYNPDMSATAVTDGAGQAVSTPSYSDPNDPYHPSAVTDGNGHVTQYTWDSFGNQTSQTSPRGTVTTNTYSYASFALGELVSEQEGSKTATTYAYAEPSGLVQNMSTPKPGTTGTGATVTTSYAYDGYGNALTETSPGNNATNSITTTYGYTSDGNYTQAAAIGLPLTVTDNLGKVTHRRYDAQGNCLSVTDALSYETDKTYNLANQSVQTTFSATGQQGPGHAFTLNAYLYPDGPLLSTSSYDESGAAIRQMNYSYGQEGETRGLSGSTEPVTYSYDALYRVTGLTDGGGNMTRYFYKPAGYLYQIAYPGAATAPLPAGSRDTVTFPSYDTDGNATKRIDGNNVETDYTYSADPQSLLTNIHHVYPQGYTGSMTGDVSLGYDAYGRRAGMTDGTGSQSYAYDDGDSSLSVTTTYSGLPAKTVSYSYYPDGSRQTLTSPVGSYAYTYDAVSRLTGMTSPYNQAAAWAYLDNGWAAQQTLSNAGTPVAVTSDAYNPRGQMTGLTNRSGSGSTLSGYTGLTYDGASNRTAWTSSVPASPSYSRTVKYAYDTRDQLTQEASTGFAYTNGFAYDGGTATGPGNPTTFKGVARSYNADNQDAANAYDGDGNPTAYGGQSLSFDPESRMTRYGSLLSCGYTGDGLRAWKQNPSGARTYFLYDGEEPVCEMDGNGNLTAVNDFGADGVWARHTTTSDWFYTFDPQGGLSQKISRTGNILCSSIYDAQGHEATTDTHPDPFSGYGGQWGYYADWETSTDRGGSCLYLLGHRFYDPNAGRFLTRDPIDYNGGINLYGYCVNDPVYWDDPEGLHPGNRYPGKDGAGKQAIRDINPTSIRDDREYTGEIYKFPNGGFSYTPPTKSGQAGGKIDPSRVPPGTTFCGNYHTHGGPDPGYDNEHFSPTDKATDDAYGSAGYLGTPGGQILKYQPIQGKPGRGVITPIGRAPTK